ncbi:hypothetical protein IDH44_09725 [Paenibacillus sp. IB182496]|uniref:Uncharacterized protein n=1 Tax=Paenibacillus sabuli TaxID=2772509 RepID=A0A927BSG6_9BACL|nr:hypothetical protein [Paenibacillus sabuli]MBD2845467.1 hypothetical protein [Paenibacillus sabuli]
MGKSRMKQPDANLQGVTDDLQAAPVNAHQAQQIQQDKNDRRHQDGINHRNPSAKEETQR